MGDICHPSHPTLIIIVLQRLKLFVVTRLGEVIVPDVSAAARLVHGALGFGAQFGVHEDATSARPQGFVRGERWLISLLNWAIYDVLADVDIVLLLVFRDIQGFL